MIRKPNLNPYRPQSANQRERKRDNKGKRTNKVSRQSGNATHVIRPQSINQPSRPPIVAVVTERMAKTDMQALCNGANL
jgi:hypothetical protein